MSKHQIHELIDQFEVASAEEARAQKVFDAAQQERAQAVQRVMRAMAGSFGRCILHSGRCYRLAGNHLEILEIIPESELAGAMNSALADNR